jgi:hypothetical protein
MSSSETSGSFDETAAEDGFSLGAEVVTRRSGYEHHGIYAGNGMVIHYAGFAKSLHRGPIEEVTLAQFAGGYGVTVRQHAAARFIGMEAVRRARSRLGEDRYRLLTNNCEHFVSWCLFGEARSSQVRACLVHPGVALDALKGLLKAYVSAERRRRASAFANSGLNTSLAM